jgi:hypothetical protein
LDTVHETGSLLSSIPLKTDDNSLSMLSNSSASGESSATKYFAGLGSLAVPISAPAF